MNKLKRLSLLPESEIADLYARPIFNQNEQRLYFEMNQNELDALNQFGSIKTKVYFILQLAYFKAKHQFFTFTFDEVRVDREYILNKYFKKNNKILQGCITRQRISQQIQVILSLFDYQNWSIKQTILIEPHIC